MNVNQTSNNNELLVKENWSKPEINLIGINEDTLGAAFTATDSVASGS